MAARDFRLIKSDRPPMTEDERAMAQSSVSATLAAMDDATFDRWLAGIPVDQRRFAHRLRKAARPATV